jgi:hypothetical protein
MVHKHVYKPSLKLERRHGQVPYHLGDVPWEESWKQNRLFQPYRGHGSFIKISSYVCMKLSVEVRTRTTQTSVWVFHQCWVSGTHIMCMSTPNRCTQSTQVFKYSPVPRILDLSRVISGLGVVTSRTSCRHLYNVITCHDSYPLLQESSLSPPAYTVPVCYRIRPEDRRRQECQGRCGPSTTNTDWSVGRSSRLSPEGCFVDKDYWRSESVRCHGVT